MESHEEPTENLGTPGHQWFAGAMDGQPSSHDPHQPYYASSSYTDGHEAQPARRGVASGMVAGIAALSLILGAAAGAGAGALVAHTESSSTTSTQSAASSVDQGQRVIAGDVSSLTTKVVQQVGPAVVSIRDSQTQQDLFGNTSQATSSGSGVIIDKSGYILTNNHVVSGGGNLTVTFANATTAPATIVGTDPSNDIAVIKVNAAVPAVAQFGDSMSVKIGETVIAIGNALGNLQNTVTEGIVSGVNRSLAGAGSSDDPSSALQNMIQTDAAINHGNSGGPLVDLSGRVIGINTAVVRSSGSNGLFSAGDQAEGLGFAIPSNTAKAVADRLIFHTPSPSLGVAYNPISPQVASSYNIPVGAMVLKVIPNSPAARAGLKPQDVITAVNGVAVDETNDLKALIDAHHIGDTVKLTVTRSGQTITLTATLGKSS